MVDFVIEDLRASRHTDNPMVVLVNLVPVNPTLPGLDHEDPLALPSYNLIPDDIGVDAVLPAKRDVCLNVLLQLVAFDMRPALFNAEDALTEVPVDVVADDVDLGFVVEFDAGLLVVLDELILLDPGVVIFPCAIDPILLIP